MQELEEIYDEQVWRVYAFFAYRLGNRDAAEDLTQATFERAVRAFRRYDSRKGSHQTWLMAIANNLKKARTRQDCCGNHGQPGC